MELSSPIYYTDIENTSVKNVYNIIAPHFDNTRHYKWVWISDFVNSLSDNSLIYDIGCGNGRNMDYRGYQFRGIDNCENFVKICQKKGLDVQQGDMTELPFEDESANHIINIAAFHHLSTHERRVKALQEFKRVLKPGGKILLSVWSKFQPEKTKRSFEKYGDNYVPWKEPNSKSNIDCSGIQMRYYYIFKLDELFKLITDSGLNVIETKWDCGNEILILQK
jgi:SAM-dependent methyltransferase